jgi:hypothetical protein
MYGGEDPEAIYCEGVGEESIESSRREDEVTKL